MNFTQIVDMCKGNVKDMWQQKTMLDFFKLPSDTYNGMCLALCAYFLGNPLYYLEERKKTTFKIDALSLFNSYKAQSQLGKAGDEFIKDWFGFNWQSRGAVTNMSSGWPFTSVNADGRYLLSLLHKNGGGHALGAVIQNQAIKYKGLDKFVFFDPNDGIADFSSHQGFNSCVSWHLHYNYKDYNKYWLTRWGF